jgi:hypothetical protein
LVSDHRPRGARQQPARATVRSTIRGDGTSFANILLVAAFAPSACNVEQSMPDDNCAVPPA